MENLKKQYRYYKKIEESGSINDKQQEKLKSIVEKHCSYIQGDIP